MIKCFWYLKSLKQLFIIWLISCFILLGNSFVNAFTSVPIWQNTTPPNDTNLSISVLPYWSFVSNSLWSWKPILAFINKALNTTKWQYVYFMWIDWKLYFYSSYIYSSSTTLTWDRQGYVSLYRICDYIGENTTSLSNCTQSNYDDQIVNDFLDTVKLWDYYAVWWKTNSTYYYYAWFCASSSVYNKSICFWWDNWTYFWLTWSINIPSQTDFSDLDWYDSQSPAVPISPTPTPWWNNQVWNWWELDWVNYTVIDTWDIVYYFENNPYYRFDKWVCYVWTDDFNTLYSSWSTLWLFRANSWWTIFDLFSSQFWNTFTINQVWTFINAWNLNYFTWFKWWNRDENNVPMFNAYYSINSWFYQDFSDDLIVPFIWNPIAFYFMGYVSSLYWEYSTPWQAISTYCYYKLWLDKDSWSMNITDDSDSSYWNNANDFINQRNKFYWLSSWSMNIQSQSWSWTILDYFTWWQDNYDFNTFFSSSFNKFKDKISLNLSDLGAWFLPTWIIMFLIAIIFFRFLSH